MYHLWLCVQLALWGIIHTGDWFHERACHRILLKSSISITALKRALRAGMTAWGFLFTFE